MATPDALYPAVAAIGVALIGLVGNWIQSRRRSPENDDSNVITALASALAAEQARAERAEQRLIACEARERAREAP